MRVAFMGKGGSGKTTCAAGFALALRPESGPVLAIDADVNKHLGDLLGVAPRNLDADASAIQAYLEPELVARAFVTGSTPPGGGSRFVRLDHADELLGEYATWNADRSIALLTVGGYDSEDAGTTCYHGKLSVAEVILHRTLDEPGQWIVTDSTAGTDSVGSSLYFASDLNVFVVEPTRMSVSVYRDFLKATEPYGVQTAVVGNKVTNSEDERFLRREIGEALLGVVSFSLDVRAADQGDATRLAAFVEANGALWRRIAEAAPQGGRDWDRYLARLHEAYQGNCDVWWDQYYGRPMGGLADRSFSYASVIGS